MTVQNQVALQRKTDYKIRCRKDKLRDYGLVSRTVCILVLSRTRVSIGDTGSFTLWGLVF